MYVFTPNTLIKSAEINSNFTELSANYTKRHQLLIKADNTGGAVDSANLGSPEVAFTGTPTNYGRASGIIPLDYQGGTIAIHAYFLTANTNNQNLNYYVMGYGNGETNTNWNIQSNQTYASLGLSANIIKDVTFYTIPANTLSAGDIIGIAMRPASAITGTIWLMAVFLEYEANER